MSTRIPSSARGSFPSIPAVPSDATPASIAAPRSGESIALRPRPATLPSNRATARPPVSTGLADLPAELQGDVAGWAARSLLAGLPLEVPPWNGQAPRLANPRLHIGDEDFEWRAASAERVIELDLVSRKMRAGQTPDFRVTARALVNIGNVSFEDDPAPGEWPFDTAMSEIAKIGHRRAVLGADEMQVYLSGGTGDSLAVAVNVERTRTGGLAPVGGIDAANVFRLPGPQSGRSLALHALLHRFQQDGWLGDDHDDKLRSFVGAAAELPVDEKAGLVGHLYFVMKEGGPHVPEDLAQRAAQLVGEVVDDPASDRAHVLPMLAEVATALPIGSPDASLALVGTLVRFVGRTTPDPRPPQLRGPDIYLLALSSLAVARCLDHPDAPEALGGVLRGFEQGPALRAALAHRSRGKVHPLAAAFGVLVKRAQQVPGYYGQSADHFERLLKLVDRERGDRLPTLVHLCRCVARLALSHERVEGFLEGLRSVAADRAERRSPALRATLVHVLDRPALQDFGSLHAAILAAFDHPAPGRAQPA